MEDRILTAFERGYKKIHQNLYKKCGLESKTLFNGSDKTGIK